MLYSNNYFTKEIRQKYAETNLSLRYLLLYGIFLGLLTFSVHFLLQTVSESVMSTTFPQLMSQSYHTVLYTYLYICYFFFLFYFLINYNYITFYEIHCNRWYLLKKLGYHGIWMTLSKMTAILVSVMMIYTTGFLTTIVFTIFLKYNFITNYFLPMYLVGCTNLLLMTVLITLGSLIIVEKDTPKYFILIVGLILSFLQLATNYHPIVRNRVLMQDVRNLYHWEQSPYFILAHLFIGIGLILNVIFALHASSYFHHPTMKHKQWFQWHRRFDFLVSLCLLLFVIVCGAIQIMILSITFASPEREISVLGTIPYVFQSTTMEDTIHKNDLVYFDRIDIQAPLEVGDIVLFKEDSLVYVERILSIHEDYITVDIDNYPEDSKEGVMLKSISRAAIYGKYRSCNRYLGAVILFANSTFGRLLLLVLPTILLFFRQRITKTMRNYLQQIETGDKS